ncbi:response regulator [Fortiea contorta]|uniref:response regulator n=1 Tax=Fortiea contorta TaxID=1892405 RepID=UPI000344E3FA|nr:response regulator [Fortiea contorta]
MSALRFLLLEDNLVDAEAIQATLRAGGIDYELLKVETGADLVAALSSDEFDVILAAYNLPDVDGMATLTIAQEICPETPFIFVSGSLGEELAIAAIKQGATDYILKQRLWRLVPSVERALKSIEERRQVKQAQLILVEQNRLLELTASGRPLAECLSAICNSISRLSPRIRACFLLPDAQRLMFKSFVTPHFPSSFRLGLEDAPINELAIGTCGTAVYSGEPISCTDIAHDHHWSQPWRDLCVAHGILACHSTPVLAADGLPLGSLMLCFDEARMFTDWEGQLAEFGTKIASIAFERDRSLQSVRASEAKYRTLFESIDEGLCICEMLFDGDGKPHDYRFLEVNSVFEDLTGLKQPTGKTARELVPGLEASWFEIYGSVVLTGESVRFENQSVAMNRWFDVNAFCIGVRENNQFAVLFTNISDRKRAEQALLVSEEQSRNIVESITEAFFAVDENWRFTYVNQTAETLLNRIPGDLIGKSIWEEYPGLFGSEFEQIYWRAMTDRLAGAVTAFYPDHDRWYEVHSYPAAQGITIYFRNVTDYVQGEVALRETSKELKQQLQKFNAVMSAVPDFIYMFDLSGKFIDANKPLLDLLQKTSAQVIGKNFFELDYPVELAARLQKQIQQVIETRQPLRDEAPFTSAFGTRIYDYIFVPIFDTQGAVEMVAGVTRDITERKQLLLQEQAAREAAEQANRIKDEFLAVLSHELRSPLNPILGWTRLLQSGKLKETRQAEALATIERNAKLQAQLIEDLLDISRIMSGKLTLTAAPVTLPFVVSAAMETVRLAAEAKNIQIKLDVDTPIAPVFGDAARLQQVVWNLLTNAVKFTPDHGKVIVELQQIDRLAQIRVIDNGKGIQQQFLPYVFEYFRQEDGSTTRKFGGLGLGLAIVRQIVEMHGGTVKAESLGENQGATFIVQLPTIQHTTPIVCEPEPTPNTEIPLSNIQILLVDDDTDTREFQAFLLQQSGAEVTAVTSGWEALQALDQLIPDVLISDIGMAEMDGYMLIQNIRSRPASQGGIIPAIALTAYAAELDQQKATQAGFQIHITKPVDAEILVSGIVSLLKNH